MPTQPAAGPITATVTATNNSNSASALTPAPKQPCIFNCATTNNTVLDVAVIIIVTVVLILLVAFFALWMRQRRNRRYAPTSFCFCPDADLLSPMLSPMLWELDAARSLFCSQHGCRMLR